MIDEGPNEGRGAGSDSALARLYDVLLAESRIRSRDRAAAYLRFLFDGIRLDGASVLDIGGGSGMLSLYAGAMGARRVVCLEPESAGSTSGVGERFRRMCGALGLQDRVSLEPVTLQAFEEDGEAFDVIVLHNSINHLDEDSCIRLLQSEDARRVYSTLFARLSSLCSKDATVLISDCSRSNFFAHLGVRNPFAPSIEWHKHQRPETWVSMMAAAGFRKARLRWTTFNRLGRPGQILLGNRLAAYFLMGHFCLTMKSTR